MIYSKLKTLVTKPGAVKKKYVAKIKGRLYPTLPSNPSAKKPKAVKKIPSTPTTKSELIAKIESLDQSGSYDEAFYFCRILLSIDVNDEFLVRTIEYGLKTEHHNELQPYIEKLEEKLSRNVFENYLLLKYRRNNGKFNKESLQLVFEIISATDSSEIINSCVDFLWEMHDGRYITSLEGFPWFSKPISTKVQAKLAAIYIEAEEFTKANEIIRELNRKNDLVSLAKYPNLKRYHTTHFAKSSSTLSSLFADVIEAGRSNLYEQLQNASKVAIVGNSPCEIGSGKAAIIDSHDLVIRFNNYPTTEDYNIDYGSKTDIWVRSVGSWVEKRDSIPTVTVLAGINLDSRGFGPKPFKNYLDSENVFTTFSRTICYELSAILGAPPSAGLMACYMVYTVKGELNKDSLFGFGFIDQLDKNVTNVGSSPAGERHNWHAELELFKRLTEGSI